VTGVNIELAYIRLRLDVVKHPMDRLLLLNAHDIKLDMQSHAIRAGG
jgi:hypothetical protein